MNNYNKKRLFDDNRTISNMNIDGMPWYSNTTNKRLNYKLDIYKINNKEIKKIIFNSLLVILPILLFITMIYFFIFILLDIFWL